MAHYLETIVEWEEVPMWKALKIWSNNRKRIKCVVGNWTCYYGGWESLKEISHDQVSEGKWFVEKM